MTTNGPLISRDELLSGLPARRASTLLFAIESRAARLAIQDRDAATLYLTPKTAADREQDFLQALAAGRDSALATSIQDLELYAPDWQPLVVTSSYNDLAALAHLLGQKYRFSQRDVPGLRVALGLDTRPVQQAYQQLYGRPLNSVYAPAAAPAERLRWLWTSLSARLESLPPFWITFLLTLPGAAGLLAMPIALSGLGLSTAIAVVVIFGLINMLTAGALAEAVARSGITRFGLGFLGQLAEEYLGRAGSLLLSIILALNNFFVLIVFFLGVAGTLQGATGLPGVLWGALAFGVCLYFLIRRSINATVGTTILIVLVNLAITLTIPLLTLPHMQAGNLTHLGLPFAGVSLSPLVWQLVLGTMLSTYFSHIMIAAYAPVVLRRDPSARSWMRGSMAAIFAVMLIAVLWLIVVNGALSPEVLAATTGTVINPLTQLVGPIVGLLGSVLVILSLGLAAIQVALVLYFVTDERIPAQAKGKWRFVLAISPVIVDFLLTEWILVTGQGSFTSFLGTLSAISLPLLGGMLPVLLLATTRRKGDFVPGWAPSWLASTPVLGLLYVFFLGSIFVHGLFLWKDPIPRAIALAMGAVLLVVTVLMLRQGLLKPRLVIELRRDESGAGRSVFTITTAGQRLPVSVCLGYPQGDQEIQAAAGSLDSFGSLRSVIVRLPALPVRELKVWAHQLLPEGGSKGLPATVQVSSDTEPGIFSAPVSLEHGQAVLPLNGAACQVLIAF